MIILERSPRRRFASTGAGKILEPASLYALGVAALAVSALLIGCGRGNIRHPAELLILGVLAAAAGSQKLWLPSAGLGKAGRTAPDRGSGTYLRSRVCLGYIFVIVGLASLGLPEAMLVAAACGLSSSLLNVPERPSLRETVLNVSALILSAALAGLALLALDRAREVPATRDASLRIAAAAAVYLLTNWALVAVAKRLADGRSLWRMGWQELLWAIPSALAGFSLAVLMALAFGLPDRTLFYLSLPLVCILVAADGAIVERMVESRRHAADLDRTAQELDASFFRVGQALAAPLDTRALHRLIVDLCQEMLAPRMSGLYLWQEGRLQLAVARFAPTFPAGRSASAAEALRRAAASAIRRGQPMSTPTDGLDPAGTGALAFAIPIASPEQAGAPGVGALCAFYDPWTRLTGARRQLLTAFATHAALALQNAHRFQVEQDIAETMRRSLLPPARMEVPDLEIGTFHEPLVVDASCIGGDYYDLFALPDGQIVASMADVCGKGIGAAVRTALSKYTVRAYAIEAPSPHQVLARANAAIVAQETDGDRFVTLACALIDPQRGSLCVSHAGHPPALLYRSTTGRCVRLGAGGPPLGVLPDAQYDEAIESFGAGDMLLLYTDGLLEARRGQEEFGLERLEAEFARLAAPRGPGEEERGCRGAQEVATILAETVRRFALGGLADDVTLLVLRNTAGRSCSGENGSGGETDIRRAPS